MKGIVIAVALLAGMAAGCQSNDSSGGPSPSSVGNGQTRNNGPFAPDSNPPPNSGGATTQPSSP